jgi:hypothetical protein
MVVKLKGLMVQSVMPDGSVKCVMYDGSNCPPCPTSSSSSIFLEEDTTVNSGKTCEEAIGLSLGVPWIGTLNVGETWLMCPVDAGTYHITVVTDVAIPNGIAYFGDCASGPVGDTVSIYTAGCYVVTAPYAGSILIDFSSSTGTEPLNVTIEPGGC